MLKKLKLGRAFGKSALFMKNSYLRTRPKIETFIKYAKVELTPPTRDDLPAIKEHCRSLYCRTLRGNWRHATVREVWLNTLVTTEVILWFFIGECIGKRHFVGYSV
ncbi:ATP synthase subunit g, mitochondrial-like [Phlebotomus papatasi]|uniref:ATP synthase subunit g, mitochondrial-like n=1 Tax=Phlebotomus papatasi TaxID=29031 RepID=UPI0024837FA1|nr:ATP synthase subunit g, mitochondrial-like [Phlebotomus papatasi]